MISPAAGKIVTCYLRLDLSKSSAWYTREAISLYRTMTGSISHDISFAVLEEHRSGDHVHLFEADRPTLTWRYSRLSMGLGGQHFTDHLAFMATLLGYYNDQIHSKILFLGKNLYLWSGDTPFEIPTAAPVSIEQPTLTRILVENEEMTGHQAVDPDAPLRRTFPHFAWENWRRRP